MNNLEYFEKGLISAIEDYNEKYSSFMDGFLDAFTEEDLTKLAALGMFPRLFSAAKNFSGRLFKSPAIRKAEKLTKSFEKNPILAPYLVKDKKTIQQMAKTYFSPTQQTSVLGGAVNKIKNIFSRKKETPLVQTTKSKKLQNLTQTTKSKKPQNLTQTTKSKKPQNLAQTNAQNQPSWADKLKNYFFKKTEEAPIQTAKSKKPPSNQGKKRVKKINPTEQKSSPFLHGLGWGVAGLGTGVAATSVYNAYKNRNRDQQEEPYFYGY
jgi:hypothetical protein